MQKELKRNNYIDIIKAIGIISIVIGHSSWSITKHNIAIGPFVYTYHIMIFMFVAGYLFNTKKADEDPNYKYTSLGKQIISFAKMYFIYNLIFCVLHNCFISLHIIKGADYNFSTIIKNLLNGLTFNSSETLLSAFWFITTFLVAKIIFTITYSKDNFNKWYRLIPIIIIFGIMGIALCDNKAGLNYRAQISILAIPIMYMGALTKKYWDKIEKFFVPWTWIISSTIIVIVLSLTKSNIELSISQIIHPVIFYPLTLVGIHFCLSLANMINKIKRLNNVFATIGRYSFHIMAMHFLIIKIIDVIYSKINGITDVGMISHFPNSYSKKLFVLYYVLAILIPTLIMVLIDKIKNKIVK